MTVGQFCWLLGGAILLAVGFTIIGPYEAVNWIVVAVGLAFWGVAFNGIPLAFPQRNPPG